ncbi:MULTISPECIES: hypothetical protein [Lapidilactobacillus]|uniref:Uncharacterized protein n=2 Tax=Lapidilactobacillus TaxID=2767884 RepID=A0ABW1UML0_9LACO|nr:MULTISPECIES: hypothetical protein [Lapidilactobacillus]
MKDHKATFELLVTTQGSRKQVSAKIRNASDTDISFVIVTLARKIAASSRTEDTSAADVLFGLAISDMQTPPENVKFAASEKLSQEAN